MTQEEMKKLADEIGLNVTFNNPPEKCGIKINGELIKWSDSEQLIDFLFNKKSK